MSIIILMVLYTRWLNLKVCVKNKLQNKLLALQNLIYTKKMKRWKRFVWKTFISFKL